MGIKLEEMFSDVFVIDIRNELQEGVHWRLEQYKTKIDESGQERTLFAIGIWVGDVAMIRHENLKCVSSHQVLKSKRKRINKKFVKKYGYRHIFIDEGTPIMVYTSKSLESLEF